MCIRTRLTALVKDEQGVTLPLLALMTVALLGMVALSVDIGTLTLQRRRLQNAVDAAALAGAQELPDSTSAADSKATGWLSKNGVGGSDVSTVTITSSKATTYITNNNIKDTIQVQSRRTVNFGFAKALKIAKGNTTTTAKVQIGSIVGGTGIMPFGLLDLNGKNTDGFGYTFNQQVKLEQPPGNAFGPGNYGLLALDGKGGNDLRDVISQGGSKTLYRVGDEVTTEPGQKTGPVKQGLDNWATSNKDTMDGSDCNNWEASHSYSGNKLNIVAKCRYRVIVIPIIDEWPNGRKDVEILGFAQVYLAERDHKDGITGYFLDDNISRPGMIWGPLNDWGTRILKVTQ